MNITDMPPKFPIPFANAAGGAYIRSIPTASQIGITAGAASLTDGFTPDTFQPIASGGSYVSGKDFNGLFNQVTAWARWQAAGGATYYDGTFSSAIGGYPKGARLNSSVTAGIVWVSTADANTTDPDGGSPANWVSIHPATGTAPQIIQQVVNYNSFYEIWSDGTIKQEINLSPISNGSESFSWPTPFQSTLATYGTGIAQGLNFSGSESVGFLGTPSLTGGTVYVNNGAGQSLGVWIRAVGK